MEQERISELHFTCSLTPFITSHDSIIFALSAASYRVRPNNFKSLKPAMWPHTSDPSRRSPNPPLMTSPLEYQHSSHFKLHKLLHARQGLAQNKSNSLTKD